MNEARQKVEAFKSKASNGEMASIRFATKYPDKINEMDYNSRLKAEKIAEDNTIALHLGVTLSDHDEWPIEQGKELAKEWAQSLPDA